MFPMSATLGNPRYIPFIPHSLNILIFTYFEYGFTTLLRYFFNIFLFIILTIIPFVSFFWITKNKCIPTPIFFYLGVIITSTRCIYFIYGHIMFTILTIYFYHLIRISLIMSGCQSPARPHWARSSSTKYSQ